MPLSALEKYRIALASQTLSAIWRGHGSAIFLEFGRLRPVSKRDGSAGNPQGEYTVMIEWSWRVESESAILCGSWSDEESWEAVFKSLLGRQVLDVSAHGRLPELSIALAGGLFVASFMTAEGQPAWTIIRQCLDGEKPSFISVENGQICEGTEKQEAASDTSRIPVWKEACFRFAEHSGRNFFAPPLFPNDPD